jgi:hypothetical protein
MCKLREIQARRFAKDADPLITNAGGISNCHVTIT